MDIRDLKREFAGKTNHQAYELAFAQRLMRPNPAVPGTFLGNTQRQEFLPPLKGLLRDLPPAPQIFDIGAGGGEIIEIALKDLPAATINFAEPNPVLFARYKERLRRYPQLVEGAGHCGLLEDYYAVGKSAIVPGSKQNLILCIHMLYHHTNAHAESIDPEGDLRRAVGTMYGFLKPGGSIFLVLANQLHSTSGQAGRYYFDKIGRPEIAERLLLIARTRERLLANGGILPFLDESFPDSESRLEEQPSASYIYGETVQDIVAMCITAEVGEINDAPFDLSKLDICAEFVDTQGQAIGLTREERDVAQKGMMRSNQPQMICTIRRNAR